MNASLWGLPRALFQELLLWLVPIGAGFEWWGPSTNVPRGYVLQDATVYRMAQFPRLGKILGSTYGGDGVATFGVPDRRGRIAAGKDDMGGTAANRITVGASGITGTTLGATGGAETVALAAANHATHAHNISVIVTGGTGGVPTASPAGSGGAVGSTDNQGSGTAHQNMPPTIICNYIIRAG